MANAEPNTNGIIFITTVPAYWLNGRYTIFVMQEVVLML